MSLHELTLEGAQSALSAGTTTAVALTEALLSRIKAIDPLLNSYLKLDETTALAQAKASDERRANKALLGPLDGIPLGIKDSICTKGVETTAASRMLHGWVPPYDATVVARLKAAGAVLLGKLNMDEFGMGSSNENSAYGPARNPWDTERTAGGSSGGSAAAVAAGLCFGALGTDTGGSLRQPAAYTNLVGLKPSYGRVSRYGVIAFASSLDQVGPLCRTVRDAALVFDVLAGHDPFDSLSLDAPVADSLAEIESGVEGLTVGVPEHVFTLDVEPEVETAVREAIATYERLGATVKTITLPHRSYATAVYYVVAAAEASSNLARFDGVRFGHRAKDAKNLSDMYERSRAEGFGEEVKRRIMLGTYALSTGRYDKYYLKAQKVRTLIQRDFFEAFKDVDLIVSPTNRTTAFRLGERTADPLKMYLTDGFTIPANLAGLPSMSVPCGFTSSGLPVGLQLTGNALSEPLLLRAARAYERENDWNKRHPALG